MRRKTITITVLILFLLYYLLNQYVPHTIPPLFPTPTNEQLPRSQEVLPASASAELGTVVKVVDGDTIDITQGEARHKIRLIGINTPETVDPRKEVECFGKEASAKMKELLLGQLVRITSDPTQADRDRYNRLLRYVYRDDGLFVNQYLIQEGYAYEYTYDKPYAFQQAFKKAQADAQRGEKGLWGRDVC